jgi:isochorismate hydrolase
VAVTEQYPRGLGGTDAQVRARLPREGVWIFEKPTFSACGVESFREALRSIDRPQVILLGIEAHVCVQQTALDLKTLDHQVFVCADAVGSRGRLDYECALTRLGHDGVKITTTESVLFELCERCGTDRFRAMLEIIKSHPPAE